MHASAAGPNALRLEVTGSVGPVIAALAGLPVVALTSREPSLEEIFLHHYDGRGRRDAPLAPSRGARFADARVRTASFAALHRCSYARRSRWSATGTPTRPLADRMRSP